MKYAVRGYIYPDAYSGGIVSGENQQIFWEIYDPWSVWPGDATVGDLYVQHNFCKDVGSSLTRGPAVDQTVEFCQIDRLHAATVEIYQANPSCTGFVSIWKSQLVGWHST